MNKNRSILKLVVCLMFLITTQLVMVTSVYASDNTTTSDNTIVNSEAPVNSLVTTTSDNNSFSGKVIVDGALKNGDNTTSTNNEDVTVGGNDCSQDAMICQRTDNVILEDGIYTIQDNKVVGLYTFDTISNLAKALILLGILAGFVIYVGSLTFAWAAIKYILKNTHELILKWKKTENKLKPISMIAAACFSLFIFSMISFIPFIMFATFAFLI